MLRVFKLFESNFEELLKKPISIFNGNGERDPWRFFILYIIVMDK